MTYRIQREGAEQTARIRGARKGGERGSSLVEQSFIIVFLLTMMLGIIDCGRALYTYHYVSNAAREATRWASVRSASCTPGGWLPGCPATNSPSGGNIESTFKTNLGNMGLDPSKVSFVTTYAVPPGVGASGCPGSNNQPGCLVHIDVTYNYTFLFAPFIAAPPIRMSSSSEMVITQ